MGIDAVLKLKSQILDGTAAREKEASPVEWKKSVMQGLKAAGIGLIASTAFSLSEPVTAQANNGEVSNATTLRQATERMFNGWGHARTADEIDRITSGIAQGKLDARINPETPTTAGRLAALNKANNGLLNRTSESVSNNFKHLGKALNVESMDKDPALLYSGKVAAFATVGAVRILTWPLAMAAVKIDDAKKALGYAGEPQSQAIDDSEDRHERMR